MLKQLIAPHVGFSAYRYLLMLIDVLRKNASIINKTKQYKYQLMLNMNNSREQLRCSRRGCSYTTNRAYNLERHERNHAKGKVPVSQCQPCPHCTYAAGSLHNLMRHISKKHVGVSVKIKAKWSSSPRPGRNKEEPPDSDVSMRHAQTKEQQEQHLGSYSSLWAWSSPQQQEINFLRRSGLNNECEIHGQTFKLSK